MDAVDQLVGPPAPVARWPETVPVPGRSDQPGSATGERLEQELTSLGDASISTAELTE